VNSGFGLISATEFKYFGYWCWLRRTKNPPRINAGDLYHENTQSKCIALIL